MKYLGLDLGTRTLGLSISDQLGIIARTYETIRFEENDYLSTIPRLKEIIIEEKIDILVLGLPKNMNNTAGYRCEETLEYKKILEENITNKIELQDERLSTKEAHNIMIEGNMSRKKRKQKVDSLAANIILQTYLDKQKGI